MLSDEYPELGVVSPRSLGGTSGTLHVTVPDVDDIHRRAVDAGAQVAGEPRDEAYGARSFSMVDPFGHRWMIQTPIGNPTVEEIQAQMAGYTITTPSAATDPRPPPVELGYLTVRGAGHGGGADASTPSCSGGKPSRQLRGRVRPRRQHQAADGHHAGRRRGVTGALLPRRRRGGLRRQGDRSRRRGHQRGGRRVPVPTWRAATTRAASSSSGNRPPATSERPSGRPFPGNRNELHPVRSVGRTAPRCRGHRGDDGVEGGFGELLGGGLGKVARSAGPMALVAHRAVQEAGVHALGR